MGAVMTNVDTFNLAYLFGLFAIVAFGSAIPVLPTGAAVSVAAVLAGQNQFLEVGVVVVVGAAGAYLGDLVIYAVLRLAGEPLAQKVGWLNGDKPADVLRRLRLQVEANEVRVLLLSRLVPAGRIPVLLAAALGGYPWRRYAIADIGAAMLWAAVYAAIGVIGRSVFPEPWQGVGAAIGLVAIIGLVGNRVQARRRAAVT